MVVRERVALGRMCRGPLLRAFEGLEESKRWDLKTCFAT